MPIETQQPLVPEATGTALRGPEQEVVRELTARTGQLDPVAPSAGLDAANYQNFAITPHDVIFFFDRGALMAGAAGAQKVYVPRSEIPPLAI